MKLNSTLKILRQEKGLKQEQLAELLNVSLSSYQKYEREKNSVMPSLDVLTRIADFYDVSIDYLLGRESKSSPTTALTQEDKALEESLFESYRKNVPEEYRKKVIDDVRGLAEKENEE